MPSIAQALVDHALQPALLLGSIYLAVTLDDVEAAYVISFVCVLLLLSGLETWRPPPGHR